MSDLLELIRARYLETLRSVNARWKILIVDEQTQRMLSSVLNTFEVLNEGVQQVDVITNQRSPFPQLPAIYILMPTSHNVELVLRDHSAAPPASAPSKGKKSKDMAPPPTPQGPKYGSAHLHFIDGIDNDLVGRLTGGLPQQYLGSLTELYINFHALEPRVFSLKSPGSFFTLYAPPDKSPKESVDRWEEEIAWMSRAIVNSLVTLGEYPLIRYYNPPSSFHAPLGPSITTGQHIAERLAKRVQHDIDAHARDDEDFPPIPDPPRPRGVLFITDRSMDVFAPFLHEFTYQAMCNDLLDVEDGTKYSYTFRNANGEMEDKEAILSEEDKVWLEVRHMHMRDALDKLIADFRQYAGEHGGRAAGGTSLNDMKDLLASLPQLKDAKEKLSLHLTMAEKCMALFESKKLPLSASVEQCCATGVTPEGKTPKTLVEEMVPLLDDRSVSSTDKLRIIALYILYRDGVPEGDKKRLYQHARLALHESDAIDNLIYLGINVSKDSGKKRKTLFKQTEEQDAYDISRYQPSLKYMLEEHFAGRLDHSLFPYVRDAPVAAKDSRSNPNAPPPTASLRSMRADWAVKVKDRKPLNAPKQRVLVFVAGGATYSEVRAVYKVSEKAGKEIYLGTTNVLTPEQFVKDLSNLDRAAGASMGSHGAAAATSYKSAKGNGSSARPAEMSQAAVDRRYQAPPPQQRGPPPPPHQQYSSQYPQSHSDPRASQYSQHDARASYHSQSSQGGYAPPPPQQYQQQYSAPPPQQQQSRPPPGQAGRPGQASSLASSTSSYQQPGGGAPPEEKKKKKLFGRFG